MRQISQLTQDDNQPWLLVGDLDGMSNSNRKCSAQHGSSTRYIQFNKFIQQNGLIDIGYLGLPYTCYNKREKHYAIFERIEMALVTRKCQTSILMRYWKIYQMSGLIMQLFCLTLNAYERRLSLSHLSLNQIDFEFHKLANEPWSKHIYGSQAYQVTRKVNLLKQRITIWEEGD